MILAIVLILFGAKKLPELAKGLGQGIKEFKKATHHVSEEVREAMAESPLTVPRRFEPATVVATDPTSAVKQDPTSPTAWSFPWRYSNSEKDLLLQGLSEAMQVAGGRKSLKKRHIATIASALAPWARDYGMSWMAPVVSNHCFQRLQASREALSWLWHDIHSVISHPPEGRRSTRFWKSQSPPESNRHYQTRGT